MGFLDFDEQLWKTHVFQYDCIALLGALLLTSTWLGINTFRTDARILHDESELKISGSAKQTEKTEKAHVWKRSQQGYCSLCGLIVHYNFAISMPFWNAQKWHRPQVRRLRIRMTWDILKIIWGLSGDRLALIDGSLTVYHSDHLSGDHLALIEESFSVHRNII